RSASATTATAAAAAQTTFTARCAVVFVVVLFFGRREDRKIVVLLRGEQLRRARGELRALTLFLVDQDRSVFVVRVRDRVAGAAELALHRFFGRVRGRGRRRKLDRHVLGDLE